LNVYRILVFLKFNSLFIPLQSLFYFLWYPLELFLLGYQRESFLSLICAEFERLKHCWGLLDLRALPQATSDVTLNNHVLIVFSHLFLLLLFDLSFPLQFLQFKLLSTQFRGLKFISGGCQLLFAEILGSFGSIALPIDNLLGSIS
jgi:hypothetical protein